MNVEIREVVLNDAQNIIDYCNLVATQTDNLAFGEGQFGINLEQEQQFINNLAHTQNGLMMIAISDNKIVGLASVTGSTRTRLIHNVELGISTDQEIWGHGIGTRLLTAIMNACQATNLIENISLTVRTDNQRAIALYQKCGFNQVGIFRRMLQVDGNYIDGLIMEYLIPQNKLMSRFPKDTITIDRPIGYIDDCGNKYPINFGFIPTIFGIDGEEQDAYIIDEDIPLQICTKYRIAIVKRKNDINDKWIYASTSNYTVEQIARKIAFIEQYFDSTIELL